MEPLGKLIQTKSDGEEQVFDLHDGGLSLGRGEENDVVLHDSKASRSHARLEFESGNVFLVDLGSANGTYVNRSRVMRMVLSPGDQVRIGSSTFRYESPIPESMHDLTVIDSMSDLENTLARETVAMTINDTSAPRIVIHSPDQTWEIPLIGEKFTIGRGLENDITIPHSKVSRLHAQIERSGDEFAIRDLQSSNGTWYRSKHIDYRELQDGDCIRIGDATLVFKQPFTNEDLTLLEEVATAHPRRPVVVVPGLMGSQLWRGNELIWPNVKMLFTNPEILTLSDVNPLEPRGIVNEVVVVPNLVKQDQYNRLGDYLVNGLGYTRGKDLLEFAYDWRKDVRESAKELARSIEDWDAAGPITIIGHSLGTLVSRYYIERLGGKRKVARAILMGGPHYGAPKSIASLLTTADLLPFGVMGDRLREVLATFVTTYQILPIYPCIWDQIGTPIDIFKDESWLEEEHRPKLRLAKQFRKELGFKASVPTLSVFGYGTKTVVGMNIERASSGEWKNIQIETAPKGDETLPERSTVLEGTDIHPVQQFHGSLFVDQDVQMRLKLELTQTSDKE